MKYVVINVFDREIIKVGAANTLIEAIKIMKTDFMKEFSKNFESDEVAESAFNDGYGKHDEWDYDTTVAWLNGRYNFDWKIIKID